ncbi:hypothetical protein LOTGIDRAFT_167389 [Lottia gigantea]|uniref:Calponin-homology (CH) domain-containing protein n=1 Tax=Lottia gigantea TaxID=225164 RepID=V3ZYT9_LOTGI|nr:hypothetical protein LOTGIDRAFT_167389 [Lottia gigantea]ESO86156.1 hypothetical protein LOTGIDRAFT_167389 [Lottia gigantea]
MAGYLDSVGGNSKERAFTNRVNWLKDEQERVQKKTFTNWMNTYLCQHVPPEKVDDLFEDIKSGVVLLSLLEVLSGETLKMERGKNIKRPHFLSNIKKALDFLEGKKIKMVNINTTDIADGKPAIVLGLIWTIILYFQIEETMSQVPNVQDLTGEGPSASKKMALPKKNLLAWVDSVLGKKYGIEVKDFGPSWRSGVAFNQLIHNINPNLIDMEGVKQQTARVNLERAFSIADSELGIPRLLDAEDVDVAKPDEKSIMTYVAQFLKKYPDAGDSKLQGIPSKMDTPDQEMSAYFSLYNWLSKDAAEILANTRGPVTDRHSEFLDYLGFKTELDRRETVYLALKDRAMTGKFKRVNPQEWQQLQDKWEETEELTRLWLLKLDQSYPGRLGEFGRWLYEAETLLKKPEESFDNPEDMASYIGELLAEHKRFFKDLEPQKKFFEQVKKAGHFEGEQLDPPHMDLMAKRLQRVCTLAPVRQRRLDYEGAKMRVWSIMLMTEDKIKSWKVKYGWQEEVEEMYKDYENLVQGNQLIMTYDSTFAEVKGKGDTYRKDAKVSPEVKNIPEEIESISTKWRVLSQEIQGLKPTFEKQIVMWKNYASDVNALTAWLDGGEKVMKENSAENRAYFFGDTSDIEKKFVTLNKSGEYLIGTSQQPIADEIRQTIEDLNNHFNVLKQDFTVYQQNEVVDKARSEYTSGYSTVHEWLEYADSIVQSPVPCIHADLKEYLLKLEELSTRVPDIENEFKVITKTAQSLVKNTPPEVINEMLQNLNIKKEIIVRIRKQIPDKKKYLKAVLPNVESLETGLIDLNKWLDEGEDLIQSHKMEGNAADSETTLEQHKAFFSQLIYQKSILESKNKVYNKICSTKPKLNNVDFQPVDDVMNTVNTRFQNLQTSSKDWERKLESQVKLWRLLGVKQTQLEEWLDNAEAILEENSDDVESLIRKHRRFFDRVDEKPLKEYLSAGKQILQTLSQPDSQQLQLEMEQLEARYKNILHHAPLRLLHLEFSLPEGKFCQNMETAEKALKQHQEQLQSRVNVKEALLKHKQIFQDGQLMPTMEKYLESMGEKGNMLMKLTKTDSTLVDRHKDYVDQYNKLQSYVGNIHLQLKQLPERWKEYHNRLSEFSTWVQEVEGLITEMKKPNLSSEEYREALAKFQKAMKNRAKYADEAKWLEDNLNELNQDSNTADARKEREKLQNLINRFDKLKPAMDQTAGKSSIYTKSFDYRDNLSRQFGWLDDAHKHVMEQPCIDSLEQAKECLNEHEGIMRRLEEEKARVMADLEAGRRLQQDKDAPDFVSKAVADLDKKWKDTNHLAKAKQEKLRAQVENWESYEGNRGLLMKYLKDAEAELEKPPASPGQDQAEKDFHNKKELQKSLNKLKGSLSEMQKLNSLLCEGASRERQGPLKAEVSDIDVKLDNIAKRLNAKLADLETTISKWAEYYKRLNHFCDWLNERESNLNEVYENKGDSPEQKLEKAEEISTEVYENHISLETLEKDARGLTQNFRSRETSALKTKLTSVRRQWESLCSRAKDRSTTLSGNVAHWQKYQNLQSQLTPWIVKGEKYCATELPKCTSLAEAQELYNLHQSFLQECENNLPIFDKMSTEAGYLLEQPNVARELDGIQKRWGNILNTSDDRTHKLDKMYGAWTAYENEVADFREILQKFQNRLAVEPNMSSSDVHVLEHELALAKSLQEEIRGHQPRLNTLQRLFEQVQPHANTEGFQHLKAQQEEIKSIWGDVNADALERVKMLNSALSHRRDLFSQADSLEAWMKKMQRKIAAGGDIYSDEIPETSAKLREIRSEFSQQDPTLQMIQQEFRDMMQNCSEEEAAILSERLDRLLNNYSDMEDTIQKREQLCENWINFNDKQKEAQARLKALQARLASPDVKEDEVIQIKREIEMIKNGLQNWNQQSEPLDELMVNAKMTIKDRATQRSLHFGSEVQGIANSCDNVMYEAERKEEHLGELHQLSDDFSDKKKQLIAKLGDLEKKINSAKVNKSDLQGLKDLVSEIEDVRDEMYALNPEYEQFRELGRQIMQADVDKSPIVQTQLNQVNEAWDRVQSLLGDKHQTYTSYVNLWMQYNDAKSGVNHVLDDIDPVVRQDIAFNNPDDVKKSLDQHRNAGFELQANQTQLEHMNNKGLQLFDELKKLPNFNAQELVQDLDTMNHDWETANGIIEDHEKNLEAQLVCWDQINSGREEVASWLNGTMDKLGDSIKNFNDTASVESKLAKYKEEAPYHKSVLEEITQKIADLKELNKNKPLPELERSQREMTEKFENATMLANQLDSTMSTFADEQKQLEKEMEEQSELLNEMRELMTKCDDLSGNDEDVVARYQALKESIELYCVWFVDGEKRSNQEVQEKLLEKQRRIAAIQDKSAALQAKYPSAESASLVKDANTLSRKLETMLGRADRIEDSLKGTLEQRYIDAVNQEGRWLNSAKEKVMWCEDIGGDRYSVESKLDTIKELHGGLAEGQQRKAATEEKLRLLRSILPRERLLELEGQNQQMEQEFQGLIGQIAQTQNKLETSIDQWSEYDGRYEKLAQWLKDMEARSRNESGLKPDTPSKKDQLEAYKDMLDEVQSHQNDFENLKDAAYKISRTTGDNRTASYATQLYTRYKNLADNIKENVDKCEQNIDDHQQFLENEQEFKTWLESADGLLNDCKKQGGDEESLNAKLQLVQNIVASKDQGLARFNRALESGEKLFPNTSNEGRDVVRHELRGLRESWDRFNDNLNDTQRELDSSRMKWSTFDENYDQLTQWLAETEHQLGHEPDVKNSLPEKKAQLQHLKTRCQDILSHKPMIDSISDKGTALSSAQVQTKLNKLNDKYNTLCSFAKESVKNLENGVDEHEKYQDATQQCRDWMSVTNDKLAVCGEVGGDKKSLQNRLDRVEDLKNSLKDGEAKVKNAHYHGEKAMQTTAPQGQATVQHELNTLTQDWENLVDRMGETQQGLMHAIQAVDHYDGSCDNLNKWLREVEGEIKSVEYKSTLNDKENQLQKLKNLLRDVNEKQNQFDEVQTMAATIPSSDGRLVNYSTQLVTRYDTAKSTLKDLIGKWEELCEEHQVYEGNYEECAEWLNTLQKRTDICSDLAGDKHDVEDRLVRLHELSAEKDQEASKIHQTIESGEKLYSTTSSEGRDVIRQDLRALREQWENVCDRLSETNRKLDSSLNQWSSYDENSEKFHKWLIDMEVKLKEDADLKTTLPDKKAQLQNHKILHQDILSRQYVMENLTKKANSLMHSTPSARVNKFVAELQKKYNKLCDTSKTILDTLDQSARDHQQYQDSYQDCQDWLNSSRDKIAACTDRSGDKMSLQSKRERLREFVNSVPEGEKKLQNTLELGDVTAKNTSSQGREILKREIEHIQREWQDYLSLIEMSETSLEQAMVQWGDFETKFDSCAAWLKNMEQQVKNYDLKSTVGEKQAHVEKLKKQREEILAHQPDIDRFTDDAQNLLHTSSDIRLSTQVSNLTNRYQGLLTLVKDLINKWEKFVIDHQTYDNRIDDFNQWIMIEDQKLSSCQQPVSSQDSLEEKKTVLQMLFAEKEHGLQKLNSSIEAGERLYPDTAGPGREKVRQELRTAKENWEQLFSGLNDAQRKVDTFLIQWSSYADGQESLQRWMSETESALRADVDMKNTLQEKRTQLQKHRSLLQDITSHQRMVDSVVEKAQGVLQTTSNPDVASFITNINSRYEKLASDAKTLIARSEENVEVHQKYQDSLQTVVDWLSHMKDKQNMCGDTTGDRHTIQNKLERLSELVTNLSDGVDRIKECETYAENTMNTTALKGRQGIQQELDVLHLDWEDYKIKLSSLRDSLEQALYYWTLYEENYSKMSQWIKDLEKQVKDMPNRSTLDEKQESLRKCQEIVQEVKGRQRDIDKFADDAQTLQNLTNEGRVGTFVSQLVTRYQNLLTNSKENVKKCEQNVEDHKLFKEKLADCNQWLTKSRNKFNNCPDTGNSRAALEDSLEKVQDLLRDRDAGFAKLNQVIESGEHLYPTTATEGREAIRQELRKLKLGFEGLYDDLSATQRKLEVSLVQWTSFDDSHSQVDNWLRDMELQLHGSIPLRSTLEEKKTQLQNFKALHQDVLSYQRVIESIGDKAQSLVHSSPDSDLNKFTSQTSSRYQKLCQASKDYVQQYEVLVSDHQQYNDAYNMCVEWLNSIREKLSACADVSGDRHAIQNRLDKIQDILATKLEGEPKVNNVMKLAEKVLPNTAPQGKDIIVRETDALREDWEAFMTALVKTKSDLEKCMDQWKEFETWHEKCASWLKDTEHKIREVDLKATLKEKITQLDKLKRLHEEIHGHQKDMDSLSDSAQDLLRLSTDTRVISQASQLSTKYQTLQVNIKELIRRWEQYVIDHQSYSESFEHCKNWLIDMRSKINDVIETNGDKHTIQQRLTRVQDLLSAKEEGLHMLQIALDNLQVVLPNTSVTGRDNMRREMQQLQQEYDALSADLNESKMRQESCLSQWTVYDDSTEQLERWLHDLEGQIQVESQPQNTLQEKKLQLERIKVLQLNINAQQSTIDNLNEKAQTLKQMSHDSNLTNQIKQIVDRYDKLRTQVKDLLQNGEKYVRDHQIYCDVFMETSDWLTASIDRLSICSVVRGDRTVIEAQVHKVQDIHTTQEIGKKKLDNVLTKGKTVLPQTSTQGQKLIQEEIDNLMKDFEHFQSDLKTSLDSLSNLSGKWQSYEEYYNELSKWIKDTETRMKTEADLCATLDQKHSQVLKQRSLHEEILNEQESFEKLGEQAQLLMQTSPDSRLSTQLTQLTSRYSSLMSQSKELLKRYEQYLADHEQYDKVYDETVQWLSNTREKLAINTDVTGDKQKIQKQIDRLKEFVIMKEEGQMLIHTTNNWGEKTMTNTSVDGRESIRQDLQGLQQDWESLISDVTDTKVMLEARLLQWTDFDASLDGIQRWIKETEKKLKSSQLKGDISEKRNELQKIKVSYQDIVSYEQMIESVNNKAVELEPSATGSRIVSDSSTLATKYNTLKEQAKDLLARNEQYVANHQDFLDACNNFNSWLRTAREKHATCSDTFGEKTSIESKIERSKSLMASLNEGAHRLAQANKAGEATLTSTSPSGQTKIRQELQAMNKEFEEYRNQLLHSQAELDNCHSRWEDFEHSYIDFNNWLKETESILRAEMEYKSTVEEKKQQWTQYQYHLDEVLSHQTSLDDVSEKAQALLQTNADAKTSHAITQLTTRYQSIIALAKDLVHCSENNYDNHVNYRERLQVFTEWLKDIKRKIKTIEDDRGNRENVNIRLSQFDEIQNGMDQGHSYLRALLDACEKTLPSTNPRGCQSIRQESEKAKVEYENLLTEMSQAKRNLENALTHWGDYDRLQDQLHDWLTDVEHRMMADPDLKNDLPEKRSTLEKYKALLADILAHKDMMSRLEEKSGQVNDPTPQTRVAQLKARYQSVLNASKDLVSRMGGQVELHEEYRKAYIACLDWLANNKHRLQRLSDYSGDKKTLQDRLLQLREFKSELKRGQEMVETAAGLGNQVCQQTAPRGQEVIQQEVKSLRDDWNMFASAVNDVEANLETSITNWSQLNEEQESFLEWIEKKGREVKEQLEPTSNQFKKQQQLRRGEDLCDNITDNKVILEKVREKGDAIAQRSSDPRLSNNMMQLSTKYQSLCSSAKNMVRKLRDNVDDHREYDDALNNGDKWLKWIRDRVEACKDTSGDWNATQDRIDDIKDITANMDEGLQKVNHVCDLAERILPNTSMDGKKMVEEQVTDLTNNWDKLNSSISEVTAMLEGVQQRWHDYEEYFGSLVRWLAEKESLLRSEPELKATLAEKKIQLDKYQMILTDIESHNRLINELADRVANLQALCDNPQIANSLSDVQQRFEAVRNRCQDIVEMLQDRYDEHLLFHETQQDCEKWLLDTSFRLMSHNSLNVSTMELTERQIEKHKAIVREITNYRSTMDHVNQIGQSLVLNNPNILKLAEQVQSQLQNLEQSYVNLQSTAQQIKDRLQDILKKWQTYKKLLEKTEEYLTDDVVEWLEEAESNIPDSIDEAQQQREATQALLEKLYERKQELAATAHTCENLGSMENLNQEETSLESPLNQFAGQVNQHMQETIAKVEKRLDRLRDMMRQWEGVDRTRADLKQWLRNRQEEVADLENRPAKLHSEAAELDIDRLKGIRDEVEGRGPAIDDLLSQYCDLTNHNDTIVDPAIRALKDDWEELLGQIDNLLADREHALNAARDLQEHQDSMDEDLANYVRELERIDQSDGNMTERSARLQQRTRRKCRATQTPTLASRGTPFDPFDSDDDSYPKRPPFRRGNGNHSRTNLNLSSDRFSPSPRNGQFKTDPRTLNLSRDRSLYQSHDRSFNNSRNFHDHSFRKGGAAAYLESESEESGYGDTFAETMNASSFDTQLNDTLSASIHLKETIIVYDSDGEGSTDSYIEGYFAPTDPENMHDIGCQTPGHVRTQTDESLFAATPRSIQTQTPRSRSRQNGDISMESIGSKKRKKKSSSRSDLLRSILSEVKDIKKQHGIDSDSVCDDNESVNSETSIKKETLKSLYKDMKDLKSQGSQDNAATQTMSQQSTQTPFFPEGAEAYPSHHGNIQEKLDEVRYLRSNRTTPSHLRGSHPSLLESPMEARYAGSSGTTPARFGSPTPMTSAPARAANPPPYGNANSPYQYADGHYSGTPVEPLPTPRMVTQDDLDAVQQRINRLQNYQISPNRSQPIFREHRRLIPIGREYVQPRRLKLRQFTRSYDDMDLGDRRNASRRGHYMHRSRSDHTIMDRYHLDDALAEAARTAKQLKKISSRMKHEFREDLRRYRY